jgi:DNA-binding response OmpR family regulator
MPNRAPIVLHVGHDIGERILVVAILEARGFRVCTAYSAHHARGLVSTEAFDVVIIEDNLPDMTGAQLAREIRSIRPSARIILVSRRAYLPAEELAHADVLVAKGSAMKDLMDIISTLAPVHPSTST